ncbi:hypothetical protein F5Y01DRAFT_50844 [Xylaria sp. FL0043]|nr:hypothetical protein F5Y01DRAFT_50844 [Xylaria sp. FL0043]
MRNASKFVWRRCRSLLISLSPTSVGTRRRFQSSLGDIQLVLTTSTEKITEIRLRFNCNVPIFHHLLPGYHPIYAAQLDRRAMYSRSCKIASNRQIYS